MPRRRLPAALARNALSRAASARARMLGEARSIVAEIRRKQAQIADAFYDIGELLLKLRRDPIPKVLGRANFEEVCEKDLGISATRAGWLVAIAQRVRRDDALRWGQDKTTALLELSNATKADDTPGMLAAEKLRRPDGKRFDVDRSSANQVRAFAKELRGRRRSVHGRTTTPEERRLAARLQAALVRTKIEAKVQAVATKPGRISKIRIEVPIDRLRDLRAALGRVSAAS